MTRTNKAQTFQEPNLTGTIRLNGVVLSKTAAQLNAGATGTPAAHLADASVAHALNATFSDTEAEAALNALGVKINTIIDALENFGIMAAS
jgi:hypothetical protein